MAIFDNFFVWLGIAFVVILLCEGIKKTTNIWTQYTMMKALMLDISKGSCYLLKVTKNCGRAQYASIVGCEDVNKVITVHYKVIAYDSFFKRYEESEIIFKDEIRHFLQKYEKTDLTVEYFKYEKFA